MQNRRKFIQQSLIGLGAFSIGKFPFDALANMPEEIKFTILHTNDTHSRMDPFPLNDKNFGGMGGVARRATIINQIRNKEKNVLLLDAGDIFQGTPYFNLFKGEAEMKALSLMKYDAITMGNHDFDLGLEGFVAQLKHLTCPVLTANYDFKRTILKGKTQPYKVFEFGALNIGVFGLGIQLKGLVPDAAFGKTYYKNPINVANETAKMLKEKLGCQMVICLSHLGLEYSFVKVSDKIIARESEHIDLIIGGHTHTFLDQPISILNKNNEPVLINQVGWGGVNLGQLSFNYTLDKKISFLKSHTVFITT